MRERVAAATTGWGACLLIACLYPANPRACVDDAQCDHSGISGICQASGWCSFPDPMCPSGHRYDAEAGDALGGQCVAANLDSEADAAGTAAPVTTELDGDGTTGESATDSDSSCPAWWDAGFARRVRLAFASVPSETLQDVPVMVRLDSSRIEYDKIRDGAADLRFVDDEGRELTYEIERWDPAGDSWLWVKVPQVAAVDQHLFAYYDNQAAVAPAFEDSVWSNGYLSVFHLSDPLADSAGTVELVESDTLSGSGKIGLARVFTESKANIELSDDDALDDLFATGVTLSGWIRIDRFDAWRVFFAKADDPYDPFEGYLLVADGSSMAISGRSDAALGKSWDSPQLNEAQWHWFAFSYDPEDPGGSFMMVDQIVTSFGSDGPDELASDAPFPMVLAPDNEDDSAFLGALDEIRISAGRRSVSWLAFQRMAMNDELFVFDAVQARPVCTPTPE